MLVCWHGSLRACVLRWLLLASAGLCHDATPLTTPLGQRSLAAREDVLEAGTLVAKKLARYQWCRFWELGRVSYVALIKKLSLAWDNFYRSDHVMNTLYKHLVFTFSMMFGMCTLRETLMFNMYLAVWLFLFIILFLTFTFCSN